MEAPTSIYLYIGYMNTLKTMYSVVFPASRKTFAKTIVIPYVFTSISDFLPKSAVGTMWITVVLASRGDSPKSLIKPEVSGPGRGPIYMLPKKEYYYWGGGGPRPGPPPGLNTFDLNHSFPCFRKSEILQGKENQQSLKFFGLHSLQ